MLHLSPMLHFLEVQVLGGVYLFGVLILIRLEDKASL